MPVSDTNTTLRHDGKPAFIRLKQQLRQDILDGTLQERLPSERELARLHGIAYMTARRAVDALVEERLVQRVPGVGTFICRTGGPLTRSGNIGLVLSADLRFGAANPFYGEVLSGALEAARRQGLSAFVCTTGDELLPQAADETSRRKVDGLICLARPDPAGLASLTAAAELVPVVTIYQDPVRPGMASVWGDDREGGRLLALHLLELGHRQFAWIGPASAPTARERFAGFSAELAAQGLVLPAECIVDANYEREPGEEAARRLLDRQQRPSVIVCGNDSIACGVLRELWRRGLRTPTDVAVTGFDDLILGSYLPCPLTSVGVDKRALGSTAVELLMSLIEGRPTAERTVLPNYLRVRDSTVG